MNTNIGFLALVEIASSITTGLAILWITYRGFQIFGRRYFGMTAESNLAYSIFLASVLFSVGFSMSSVVEPLLSAFRLFSEQNQNDWEVLGSFALYGGIYVGVAYVCSMLVTIFGVVIYTNLTPLSEFEEIKNNNVGVAIVVSSIVVTLSLLSKPGIALLIESLLPYPELPPMS